ncbi:hypothetical protein VP01_112g1 [Puccinia sorghi]|uniref:Uncharacterized protein n=1 Tax=Puccinia sorghi TaxID=27349 RepID=A0A0L6VTL1_9BASI|nr:hypothetical protein VP01_112g1 [Puccinia sorghi]
MGTIKLSPSIIDTPLKLNPLMSSSISTFSIHIPFYSPALINSWSRLWHVFKPIERKLKKGSSADIVFVFLTISIFLSEILVKCKSSQWLQYALNIYHESIRESYEKHKNYPTGRFFSSRNIEAYLNVLRHMIKSHLGFDTGSPFWRLKENRNESLPLLSHHTNSHFPLDGEHLGNLKLVRLCYSIWEALSLLISTTEKETEKKMLESALSLILPIFRYDPRSLTQSLMGFPTGGLSPASTPLYIPQSLNEDLTYPYWKDNNIKTNFILGYEQLKALAYKCHGNSPGEAFLGNKKPCPQYKKSHHLHFFQLLRNSLGISYSFSADTRDGFHTISNKCVLRLKLGLIFFIQSSFSRVEFITHINSLGRNKKKNQPFTSQKMMLDILNVDFGGRDGMNTLADRHRYIWLGGMDIKDGIHNVAILRMCSHIQDGVFNVEKLSMDTIINIAILRIVLNAEFLHTCSILNVFDHDGALIFTYLFNIEYKKIFLSSSWMTSVCIQILIFGDFVEFLSFRLSLLFGFQKKKKDQIEFNQRTKIENIRTVNKIKKKGKTRTSNETEERNHTTEAHNNIMSVRISAKYFEKGREGRWTILRGKKGPRIWWLMREKLGSDLMIVLLFRRLLMIKYKIQREAKLWLKKCLVQALLIGTTSNK